MPQGWQLLSHSDPHMAAGQMGGSKAPAGSEGNAGSSDRAAFSRKQHVGLCLALRAAVLERGR